MTAIDLARSPLPSALMQPGGGLNVAHLVAARDLPVTSLADVVAKRYPLRIAVDRKGTTDNWIFNTMLAFYGVRAQDLPGAAWYGRLATRNRVSS